MTRDKICEYVETLRILISISDDYGHLTLRNIIDRFKARVKYLTENINLIEEKNKEKEKEEKTQKS